MDQQVTNDACFSWPPAGILVASRNPGAASGFIQGSQAVVVNNQPSYSRDAEREAGQIRFQILVASSYDVNSAHRFFSACKKLPVLQITAFHPIFELTP